MGDDGIKASDLLALGQHITGHVTDVVRREVTLVRDEVAEIKTLQREQNGRVQKQATDLALLDQRVRNLSVTGLTKKQKGVMVTIGGAGLAAVLERGWHVISELVKAIGS